MDYYKTKIGQIRVHVNVHLSWSLNIPLSTGRHTAEDENNYFHPIFLKNKADAIILHAICLPLPVVPINKLD